MRRTCSLFSGVLVILLAWACLAKEADWPQWRGPNRDGKSPDKGLLKEWPQGGPERAWKASGIGSGYASVAICDGMIYTTGIVGDDLVITALNMEGTQKWQKAHGPAWREPVPGSRGTPTIDEGKLYLLSGKGLLVCYDAKTGEKEWAADITTACGGIPPKWGYAESVLIYKDVAIVTPGGRNCIVAFKKSTGKPAWGSKGLDDPAGYSSCIVVKHRSSDMIVQLTSKGLVGISAKTGRFLWRDDRAAGRTAVCPTPIYADGYVFAASGYNNGGACVKLTGSRAVQAWDTKDMICHHGGYITVDGYIYGNHLNGWSCLDLKTGRKMWESAGVGKGSLCYADGMLYTYAEDGGRIAIVPATPEAFSIAGQFSVEGNGKSWAHPAVIGGRLYLRYDDNLYAFDVAGK